MHALILAAALLPSLAPTPVGAGPRYHPAPALRAGCDQGALTGASRVHVELLANRRAVVVPAAIGLRGATLHRGHVTGASCRALLWTTDPSGVVDFAGSATLGSFFQVWGRPLAARRLLSFAGPVSVFRNGERVAGDPALLPLKDGDEIVVEVGGYVPPPRGYRFPK